MISAINLNAPKLSVLSGEKKSYISGFFFFKPYPPPRVHLELPNLVFKIPYFTARGHGNTVRVRFKTVAGESASINPFTPKSDQYQISPAPSVEILHHTVWRSWLVIAYSDEK